jgi:hypothetical protein
LFLGRLFFTTEYQNISWEKKLNGTDMKRISLVVSLSLLVLFLLVTPVIGSSDWVKWMEDDDGTVHLYKKRNIDKGGGKYIVQVWDKEVFSDKSREKVIQYMRDYGESTEGFEKLLDERTLFQIDCKSQKGRILYMSRYNKDGKLLWSQNYNKSNREYMPLGSKGEIFLKVVCQ